MKFTNTTRKLPIGIQDFEYLRTDNCLYVDKTLFIYKLLQHGKPYFLGRPRRFGKSLFLSTLKAYFEGKKQLFEGLKIAELETEWIKFPVLYLDFNKESYSDVRSLEIVIDDFLQKQEQQYGVSSISESLSVRFANVIAQAKKKTGLGVVVLIDEYDKMLINTMDKPDLNKDIRTMLKGFYGVLKAEDANLKFVFLTGVTKFSQVSVFSDLNHLTDISLNKQYAEVCGISETELLQNFQPEIQALAEENHLTYDEAFAKLKKFYDGYHFAKESVDIYNPFSIIKTFGHLDFAYYWFETGTPTFLVKHLANTGFEIPILENNITILATSLMDYRAENEDYTPLLYQSGYLTIKEYDPELDEYTLGFPNEEVKYGFLNQLLQQFTPSFGTSSSKFSANGFIKLLRVGDIENTMIMLKAYFATIEYDAIPQKLQIEKFYQFVFWQLFTLMGQFIRTEVKNNKGRTDAVVKTADYIFVFEFKMDDKATAEDALKQINSNDYAIPYTADHRKLVKIGVEFSKKEKGLKRWVIE
ncbi:MAG: ATP-binding protein [Marinilabiliaceae bacterium]|nr:ATP-binding protein [Marinilabiliaceae bacterium]